MRIQSIRRFAGLALAAAVLMASASQAVVLQGRGELHAMGNGLAVFQMVGKLVVRGGGVLIVDPHVRIETQGHGTRTVLEDGRVLYEGYGRAAVASPVPMRVKIAGAHIRLHAKGAGRAFLKGVGRIQTDDLAGDWAEDPEIEFDSGQ